MLVWDILCGRDGNTGTGKEYDVCNLRIYSIEMEESDKAYLRFYASKLIKKKSKQEN